MQEDGSFNDAHFSSWLQRVKEICTELEHLEDALINIGEVLSILHLTQMGCGSIIL
jgi:hypothetical protein